MLRHLPFVSSLVVAFAVGFFLVSAVLDDGPDGRVATSGPDQGRADRSSIRAKAPPVVKPKRRAALPATPKEPAVRPASRSLTRLVAFEASPFPYDGVVPRTRKPFLNHEEDGRLARKTYSGRVYWADKTYSDRRSLLHVPKGFDPHRPGVMVVFFHGHGATLQRDVAVRQRVPAQITESGVNAVLVAPQFAVDARDSSAGNFWKPGGMRRFLDEVTDKLAGMHDDPMVRRAFATMPVVIVGYSGGYLPTAAALANGQIGKRVKGVVLLDGLYGEVNTFANWIERDSSAFFLSAYTASTRRGNASLRKKLDQRQIAYGTELGPRLGPGSVTFVAADEDHRDYVTRAWAENPIADLLARLTGVAPRPFMDQSASLAPGLAR